MHICVICKHSGRSVGDFLLHRAQYGLDCDRQAALSGSCVNSMRGASLGLRKHDNIGNEMVIVVCAWVCLCLCLCARACVCHSVCGRVLKLEHVYVSVCMCTRACMLEFIYAAVCVCAFGRGGGVQDVRLFSGAEPYFLFTRRSMTTSRHGRSSP